MPIGLKRGLFFGERVEKAGIHTEPAVAGSWNRLVLSGLRGTFLCWWTIWYLSTNYSLHIFNFEQAPNLTCKIPKSASPGAYILQRPFLWGLIYGGEICPSKSAGLTLRGREIYVSKSIGLAYNWREILCQ